MPCVLRMAKLKCGDVFVDVGCGSGRLVRAAAQVPGVYSGMLYCIDQHDVCPHRSINELESLLTICCFLCVVAVGIEANTVCMERCMKREIDTALCVPLPPGSSVHWRCEDVTTIRTVSDFLSTVFDADTPPDGFTFDRVVVYVFMYGPQLLKLTPLLLALVRSGARVVSYDTHLTCGPVSSDIIVANSSLHDSLCTYALVTVPMPVADVTETSPIHNHNHSPVLVSATMTVTIVRDDDDSAVVNL